MPAVREARPAPTLNKKGRWVNVPRGIVQVADKSFRNDDSDPNPVVRLTTHDHWYNLKNALMTPSTAGPSNQARRSIQPFDIDEQQTQNRPDEGICKCTIL
jgi:hypothetical protein